MERLLHVTEQPAFLFIPDIGCIDPLNPHLSLLRFIKSKQEFQNRTFSGSGMSHERHLFSLFYLKAQLFQDLPLVISKRYIAEFHKRSFFLSFPFFLRNHLLFRKFLHGKEFVNSADAGNGGLDRLDFHAKAFYRRKNL